MQKIIKIGFMTYFAVLLIILWTYISYSDTSEDLRMHVATTGHADAEHPNLFGIWVYEKDRHFDFSQWRISSQALYYSKNHPHPYVLYNGNVFETFTMSSEYAASSAIDDIKPFIAAHTLKKSQSIYDTAPFLPPNGQMILTLPPLSPDMLKAAKEACEALRQRAGLPPPIRLPYEPYETFSLQLKDVWIRLVDPTGKIRKEVLLSLEESQGDITLAPMSDLTWAEPGPFLLNERGDILLDVNGFESSEVTGLAARIRALDLATMAANAPHAAETVKQNVAPSADTASQPKTISWIATKVTFGRVGVATAIPVSSLGLARASLTVETPSDLEFIYRGKTFYGSFTPNERPLYIEVPDPVILPGQPLSLNARTIVGDNDITFNYYAHGSWIGRTRTRTDSIHPLMLDTPSFESDAPEIIILSGCLSAWDCKDTAQRVALIASPKPISLRVQAIFALKTYYESTFENEKNKAVAGLLYHRVLTNSTLSSEELTLARDYALARIASGIPATEPSIVARTEPTDKQAKLDAKANHRAKANPILIFMIVSGIITFILAAYRSRINVNQFNVDHDPEFAIREAQNDKLKRILFNIILLILGISVAGGLYYMMQIL
ncbi:MAG: hypothetical protein IIY06_11140 [Proteobacteria bacterium]|nr:hypothetical protein [Pseudomonadota bacterium]